jgi:hypothetical protein
MSSPQLENIPRTIEQARADYAEKARTKIALWYASAEPHLILSKDGPLHVASFGRMEDRDAVLAMRDALGPLIALAEQVLREAPSVSLRTAAHAALMNAVRGRW